MSDIEKETIQALERENSRLQEELELRDQLVQQLTQELFRLVKRNPSLIPQIETANNDLGEAQLLQRELQQAREELKTEQEQLAERDRQIEQLKQSVEELTDRNQVLVKAVQELPSIYRQKFAERLTTVKEKVERLQRENRQLYAELQSVSYRLALSTRRSNSSIDLPQFNQQDSQSVPTFGNV